MIYEMCRKFADEELAPHAGEWDKKHEFPKEAVSKLVSSVCMMVLTSTSKRIIFQPTGTILLTLFCFYLPLGRTWYDGNQ